MRVMHILHRSVPGLHGYAVRSREIILHQQEKGIEPIVVTSPSQSSMGELDSEGSEVIDGIRYFRTCGRLLAPSVQVRDASRILSSLRVLQNIVLYRTALRIARRYRPAVIHAHSPFTCGIAGSLAARGMGIPSVYEVRGIWEDSHVGRGRFGEGSLVYRAVRSLENVAMRRADACCVISNALAVEIESRGIPREKITITPNAVDVDRFSPGRASAALRDRYGLGEGPVMGYIGSFFRYEGLELLIDAMATVGSEFPHCRLLLVGGGEMFQELKTMVRSSGLGDRVIFTGPVPYVEIADYYRVCDLLVLPRRETRETRLVTPLKPLEIMAMGKALIASDIGGHREMIEDGFNGLFFQSGNVAHLVKRCRELICNPALRDSIGRNARKWVEENRDWRVVVERYVDLYAGLTAR